MKHTQSGFTLIELMVVVTVVALLAMIALPSYQNSVRKSRRTDARIALIELAQTLERCQTQFGLLRRGIQGIEYTVCEVVASEHVPYLFCRIQFRRIWRKPYP